MSANRARSIPEEGLQPGPFVQLGVIRPLVGDPDDAWLGDTARCQLVPQLLHEDALAWSQFVGTLGPLRPAAAVWIGTGNADAHRGSTFDANQDDLATFPDVDVNGPPTAVAMRLQ